MLQKNGEKNHGIFLRLVSGISEENHGEKPGIPKTTSQIRQKSLAYFSGKNFRRKKQRRKNSQGKRNPPYRQPQVPVKNLTKNPNVTAPKESLSVMSFRRATATSFFAVITQAVPCTGRKPLRQSCRAVVRDASSIASAANGGEGKGYALRSAG